MDIYSISGQKGVRKTCLFLYIYAHSEISKSMDINSISGQKGVRKTCLFLCIVLHSDISKSMDISSISGQNGLWKTCIFLYILQNMRERNRWISMAYVVKRVSGKHAFFYIICAFG